MATNSETILAPQERRAAGESAFTTEMALYVALLLVGLVMRLARLGQFPLLASEANTALAAWRGAHGDLWRPALYSPVLFAADYAPFALSGGSVFAARLLTALAGTAMVVLPYFARDFLGRRGALLATGVLALSPTWLMASRTADGQMVSILALAIALLFARRGDQQGDARSIRFAWTALAIAFCAAWNAYTPLLAVGVWFGVRWLHSHRQSEPVDGEKVVERSISGVISRQSLIVFGTVALLASSALGLNPSGIGATVSLAGLWFATLAPGASGAPWYTVLANLAMYEPLMLALGILGVLFALRDRDTLDWALLCWLGVALVLGVLFGHRQGLWLLDVLLPLTILAARGFDRLVDTVDLGLAAWDWGMLWIALCLVGLAFLQLAAYIQNGQSDAAWLAGLGLGLVVLSLAAYGFWRGGAAVARVGLTLAALLLASYGLRTSVVLNYRTARQPHEALVGDCVSDDLARLPELIHNTSLRLVQDKRAAVVRYDASLDPWMGWYLRGMSDAQAVDYADAYSGADILITSERAEGWYPDGYAAERLRLTTAWPNQELSLGNKLRWLIYRDDVGAVEPTMIQIWVKLQTAESQP